MAGQSSPLLMESPSLGLQPIRQKAYIAVKKNPAGAIRRGFCWPSLYRLALQVITCVGIEAVAAWNDVAQRLPGGMRRARRNPELINLQSQPP